jgi:aminoglycoside 2'-N-acetyltransferase I
VAHDVVIREREELSTDELRRLSRWLEDAYEEGPWRWEHWSDLGTGPHATLSDDDGSLLAHACVDWVPVEIDGRTVASGYLEDVATRKDARGRGYGTAVVQAAQREIERRADIGLLATGGFGFYERLGWRRWAGSTSVSERDGSVTRTEDEDGAIMALFLPQTPAWVRVEMPIRRPRRDPEEAW